MYQTLSQIEAARERQRTQPTYRELCTEYAGDMTAEMGSDIEQAMAPGRRLPIDPPNLRGNMPRNERKPLTSPPTPQVVPGVLTRPLVIPRSAFSRLETTAQAVYPTLTHEARVLLRLLDHAKDSLPESVMMISVSWETLIACFRVRGWDSWEPSAALWAAVDQLVETQVLCILPSRKGHVLLVSEHSLRTMLRATALNGPENIPTAEIAGGTMLDALMSLEQPKA